MLIDGRSVYTPLYSGVYWDMQDVLPEDIERIEVISGPGATLWGANAVNGVINIITQEIGADPGRPGRRRRPAISSRAPACNTAGASSDDLAYRLYAARLLGIGHAEPRRRQAAHDHWSRPQGGFRLDWTPQRRR